MSVRNVVIVFIVCALITYFYRALPFLFFSRVKVPAVLEKLKDILPAAFMAILVVYCFKSVPSASSNERLYLAFGALTTVLVHLWKRNTILSVVLGTAVYMFLLNVI